jgi:hypothetical protein
MMSGGPRRTAARSDKRGIATIGREFTVADLTAAVQRVLKANLMNGQIDERHIASMFARRVRAPVGRLVVAMKRNRPATAVVTT